MAFVGAALAATPTALHRGARYSRTGALLQDPPCFCRSGARRDGLVRRIQAHIHARHRYNHTASHHGYEPHRETNPALTGLSTI